MAIAGLRSGLPCFTLALLLDAAAAWTSPLQGTCARPPARGRVRMGPAASAEETDVVVIGAGVGGLSCAAMCSKYGLRTTVFEAHSIAGGCAHGFERGPFMFDSGPSLWNGMSAPSTNPLRQVLDAVQEDVEWIQYDGWEMIIPQGRFYFRTGDAAGWERTLREFGGPTALEDWARLQKVCGPVTAASAAIPALCLRDDPGALIAVLRQGLPGFLGAAPVAKLLTGRFSEILDKAGVRDRFLRDWFAYLSFALSGLDDTETLGAAVAYTIGDLYPEGRLLDYPRGGSAAVVDALVRGVRKHGGDVRLSCPVQRILVNDAGRAIGVEVSGGRRVFAKVGVVSNAPVVGTVRLLPEAYRPAPRPGSGGALNTALEMTPSFMHLHLAIRSDGLAPESEGGTLPKPLTIHYSVILDDFSDICADRNMVIVSIPTILDRSLAPEGHHIVHAYYAADEEYQPWEGLDRRSPEYEALKSTRAANLWRALELIIPDIRARVVEELVASPLTHERFLRRPRGTYGPTMFPSDGTEVPWARTQVDSLLHCGDSCYPGIGVPSVAASGACAASTLVPLGKHLGLLRELRERGVLKP